MYREGKLSRGGVLLRALAFSVVSAFAGTLASVLVEQVEPFKSFVAAALAALWPTPLLLLGPNGRARWAVAAVTLFLFATAWGTPLVAVCWAPAIIFLAAGLYCIEPRSESRWLLGRTLMGGSVMLGFGCVLGGALGGALGLIAGSDLTEALCTASERGGALVGASTFGPAMMWVGLSYSRYQEEFDSAFGEVFDLPKLSAAESQRLAGGAIRANAAALVGVFFIYGSICFGSAILRKVYVERVAEVDKHGLPVLFQDRWKREAKAAATERARRTRFLQNLPPLEGTDTDDTMP